MERRTGAGIESFVSACRHDSGVWQLNYERHIIGAPLCTVCRKAWKRSDAPGTFMAQGPDTPRSESVLDLERRHQSEAVR